MLLAESNTVPLLSLWTARSVLHPGRPCRRSVRCPAWHPDRRATVRRPYPRRLPVPGPPPTHRPAAKPWPGSTPMEIGGSVSARGIDRFVSRRLLRGFLGRDVGSEQQLIEKDGHVGT